jgi:hypothetical protein
LQAGNAVNFFGYGLILPFEIIYLHQLRGFGTATAGFVLAAILGTATLVTPASGTLLDHDEERAGDSAESTCRGSVRQRRASSR